MVPFPDPTLYLSFGLVFAGRFDGKRFESPRRYDQTFYRELRPISPDFDPEALDVNRLNRDQLLKHGVDPAKAMTEACLWVRKIADSARPVLVAYPLSFDWTFLYWYFVKFSSEGSPFNHSSCFDIKTAIAVKNHLPIAQSGQAGLVGLDLDAKRPHTHNALDDAIEQAVIFSQLFKGNGTDGGTP